jgi:predicted Ser/Thr protein kinase
MDPQTWQRAKEWLVEAATLPEPERAAYLAQRCPDDALRAELLEMLASDTTLSGIVGTSTLTRGTRLGPYEIETKIGEGGMGEVYRARDGRLGRDVAIKVIPTPFATDRDRLARFAREAKLLASLNHPHICTLFDVGRESDTDYIVMEFVDGELLSDRLRKGPLPTDKALTYAIEIADALDKAHAVGIVHRDLKPGNVMVAKSGTKLLDFGLARRTHALSRDDVTKSGTILGTLRYMAPEQLRGADADVRSDVWAFGCVLYQMLTGRAPFDAPSETAIGAAILETEPPPLSSVVPGISPALQRVVDRCLAKAADDRWQSVADLRHELKWIASGAKSDERTPARAARTVTSWRARLAWGAALVLVGVALAVIAMSVWNARRGSPSELARVSILLPDGIEAAHFLALSNDGQQLAYVGRPRDGNVSLIWVRQMGEVEARPLEGTAGSPMFPFWSPTGRELGFFSDQKLKVVDVKSGTIRELSPAPNGRGGTWAGHTILFVPDQHAAVHRIGEKGGDATPVTRPQPNELHRFPRFLADGVHFLFTAELDSFVSINVGSLADAGIASLDRVRSGNRPSEGAITQAYAVHGMLVFGRGGTVLAQLLDETHWRLSGEPIVVVPQGVGGDLSSGAFAVSDNAVVYRLEPPHAVSQLTWLSRSGAAATPIWTPGTFQMVQLSNNDSRAIVARSDGSKLVFHLISVARPDVTTLGEGSGSPVLWSRDGTRVLFRKPDKIFENNIYSFLVDGGGDERLELDQPNGNKYPLGWSDTDSLLYAVNTAGPRSDLWEKPSSGPAHVVFSSAENATINFVDSAFTQPSNLIASAVDGTLYVQPIRHGGRVTVDSVKSHSPRWRADGRELYYLNEDSLMAVDIIGADPVRLGRPHMLFAVKQAQDARYSPTRDGQRFLLAVPHVSTVPSQVGVVLNWTHLVGK